MDRVRRAYRVYEGVDPLVGLLPQLLAEGVVTGLSIPIVQLVAIPVPWLTTDVACGADHGLDQLLGDLLVVARHIGDLRPVGAHGVALLVTEGVGEDEV